MKNCSVKRQIHTIALLVLALAFPVTSQAVGAESIIPPSRLKATFAAESTLSPEVASTFAAALEHAPVALAPLPETITRWEIVPRADDQGAWREVEGIVCDNLPSMPETMRNRLVIDLPGTMPSDVVTQVKLTGNPGIPFDRTEAGESLGTLRKLSLAGKGELLYEPPAEYNRRQQPSWVGEKIDIDSAAKRSVWIRVRFKRGNTILRERTKEVVLARPALVLVHGINSTPRHWQPWLDFLRHRQIHMPIAAVNHSVWDNGNGSVELGAQAVQKRIREVLANLRNGLPIAEPGFEYPYNADYRGLRLATRRVDLIGWSYGGVIARWYIAANGDQPSFEYQGVHPVPVAKVAYNHDVRKFCTLGSMWRGVPLCNYLNEVRFAPPPGYRPFGEAPLIFAARLLGLRRLKDVPDYLQKKRLPVQVPSMEAMAVESPWLVHLNKNPYRSYVAYASVAGDDDRYLDLGLSRTTARVARRVLKPAVNVTHPRLVNTYGLLDTVQRPKWFAPLSREWLPDPVKNFSDGVVPVWSAAIPGSYRLVDSNHSNYPGNNSTQRYLLQWLHNSDAETGATLNSQWNTGVIQSRVLREGIYWSWSFEAGYMAPADRRTAYQGGKIGRLSETFLSWR